MTRIVPKVLVALFALYQPISSYSQCGTAPTSGTTTINTSNSIVNNYYPGTGNLTQGSTTLTLGTLDSRGASTTLAAGDLLLIIQMQGADYNSANSSAYGDGSTGSGILTTNLYAGKYEYSTVASVTGSNVTLSSGLINNYYTSAATRSYQVIRVPRYYNLTVNNNRSITGPSWNGASGGVIVLEAANTLNLGGTNAIVSADTLGFRGGGGKTISGVYTGNTNGSGSITASDYRFNSRRTTLENGTGAAKGEGIAGTPRFIHNNNATFTDSTSITTDGYTNGSMGRGAPGNAGGGGTDGDPNRNQYNTGGGGGGNGGPGGRGGSGWDGGSGDSTTYPYGGLGGSAFYQSSTLRRVIMGGGGGAGTANNATAAQEHYSSGATGGGIIIVRAKTFSGSGTFTAVGDSAKDIIYTGMTDAAGGGGAGGTIVLLTNSSTAAGANTLKAVATGGDGGDMKMYFAHGPGGGGGGGVIISNFMTAASMTVTAGKNGLTRATSQTGPLVRPYGSLPGTDGFKEILTAGSNITLSNASNVTSPCGALPVTLQSWTGVYRNDKTYLSWQITTAVDFSYFVVERSSNGVDYSSLSQLTATSSTGVLITNYSYTDIAPAKGVNYYRLKMVDADGSYRYSDIITIRTSTGGNSASASPNPFTDRIAVTIESSTDEAVHLRLFTSDGKQVWQKTTSVTSGTNVQYFTDFQSLVPGVYYLKVDRLSGSSEIKLLKR